MRKKVLKVPPSSPFNLLLLQKCAWGFLRKPRAKKKATYKKAPPKRGTHALPNLGTLRRLYDTYPPHFDF